MTGIELRRALGQLDLRQRQFARLIEKQEQTVSDWCRGKWPVPKSVELLVEKMLAEQPRA